MLVGIHQPHYLPWLRYFEKIDACDAFILLDTVQFTRNGWQNRNKIKTQRGPLLLTVPVHVHGDASIAEVTIDNSQAWQRRHLKTIEQNYRAAAHFDFVYEPLRAFYESEWTSLSDFNAGMIRFWLETIGIETPLHVASELRVDGRATDRLVNLIKAVGGDCYYSGAYALDVYLDPKALENAGIGLQLQEWNAPVYPQLHGEFAPDLSILDLAMNTGPDALSIIRRGGGRGV